MVPAEPRQQPEEGSRPGRSIQQTARDHATQIGVVQRDLNIHYHYESGPDAEVALDLGAYREHQLSQLAIWERQYTRLDVDPAVALAGHDLRPVPDFRLALTEAFIRHKRLVVVGGAGAGKTTSMLYLVASVLPGGALARDLEDFIPVYIELGRFRADTSTSPLDHLLLLVSETLFRGKACAEPPSLRRVRQLLTSHRFLFLLDGLNEAQAALRASCQAAIDDLAKLYSDHRIVLSTRPHGFSPSQGWDLVLLRELEDSQIPGFVERYTQDEASQSVLQTVFEAHNPLLRLPLFLSLVIRMSGSPLPDLQRQLRSRSGLVAQYVEFLLQRDLASGGNVLSLDRMRDTLGRLAQAFQIAGQVLSVAEARKTVEAGAPGPPEEAQQTLDNLCERGLLATDGQNLRFWHQTIQEYFYAGCIVRRWRGSSRKVGRMPLWLRRLAARPEEEEALAFLVAHLCDEEAEAALQGGLRANPALAISWADDLCLEGRAELVTERFPATIRRFARAASRYTGAGQTRGSNLLAAGFLACFWVIVVPSILPSMLVGKMGVEEGLASDLSLCCGILLGSLFFLHALLSPPVKKLESLLGAIPEVRNTPLRQALSALAQEINNPAFRPAIRALASVSAMETVNAEGLVTVLRASEAPYVTTRLIGHLDAPFAVPLLIELVKLNNSLSEAALEALSIRATRLRDERQRIVDILWEVWNDHEIDHSIRRIACKLLIRAGQHPEGRGLLFQHFLFRLLKGLGIALGMVIVVVALDAALESIMGGKALIILAVGLSVLIWWDARRIGVHGIQGHPKFEKSAPLVWALCSFLPLLLIPYLLDRQRICRDAAPVDWDAILRAVKAAEPHGDSRSITHPPSAPSPRR